MDAGTGGMESSTKAYLGSGGSGTVADFREITEANRAAWNLIAGRRSGVAVERLRAAEPRLYAGLGEAAAALPAYYVIKASRPG